MFESCYFAISKIITLKCTWIHSLLIITIITHIKNSYVIIRPCSLESLNACSLESLNAYLGLEFNFDTRPHNICSYAPIMEDNYQFLDLVNLLLIYYNCLQFVNTVMKDNYVANILFNLLNLI